MASAGLWSWKFHRGQSHLWSEFVDLLDCSLDFARVYGFSDLYSILYSIKVWRGLHVGFESKVLSCDGIAFAGEVVHDKFVEIAIIRASVSQRVKLHEFCQYGRIVALI